MKRILILYAKYGGGHQSAANSIQAYIEDHYFYNAQVKSVDCIEYVSHIISNVTTASYKKMAKKTPKLWKKIYYGSKSGKLSHISSKLNTLMSKRLHKLFKEYLPDLVISTHPFGTQMTSYLIAHQKIDCKLATILTDFAPHEQWLVGKEHCDYFFVSNDKMKEDMINLYGVPSEKIYTTGIPLSNTFSFPFYDDETYKTYKLKKDKKIILFFGGGEFGLGQKRTIQVLQSLAKHLDKYQIVAISGRNKQMNDEFLKLYDTLQNEDLHILKYTPDVPDLMHISTLVVTKPGGLTSSESLASNLPIIITNPIPRPRRRKRPIPRKLRRSHLDKRPRQHRRTNKQHPKQRTPTTTHETKLPKNSQTQLHQRHLPNPPRPHLLTHLLIFLFFQNLVYSKKPAKLAIQ